MNINKVFIYGGLTRDPEIKALPNGNSVTSFGVATTRTWKDKNGVKQESVDYHNIVAYGKRAEVMHQYLKHGNAVFIEGRISTRSWYDKEDKEEKGPKRYRTEIIVENFQFGPKGGASSGGDYTGGASAGASASAKGKKTEAPKEEMQTIEYPEEDINPDDIPF